MKKILYKLLLTGGIEKPFRIPKLTISQLERISKDPSFNCGTSWLHTKLFDLPAFTFEGSCDIHDLIYRRGGGIIDKLEADFTFYFLMVKGLLRAKTGYINKLFLFLMATTYFIAVFFLGFLSFNWGKYEEFNNLVK